jgi:two-component system cell cycle response regulator DivK
MSGDPPTILYVEDNRDNWALVQRILRAEGYRVLEARDARSALLLSLRQPPDLILVDINLPEVDGLSLTSLFKSHPAFARVPILALTANVMRGDREQALAAGCDGYIQKPIDVDRLASQVSRFLPVVVQEAAVEVG